MSDAPSPPPAKSSIVVTTAGSMTAAALAPSIAWGIHGFALDKMPESTPLLIAATTIVLGHAAGKVIAAWWNKEPLPPLPMAPPPPRSPP